MWSIQLSVRNVLYFNYKINCKKYNITINFNLMHNGQIIRYQKVTLSFQFYILLVQFCDFQRNLKLKNTHLGIFLTYCFERNNLLLEGL